MPCGTTGESPTLSHAEHYDVITRTVDVAAGRVPVIAGCGSNDTATAIAHMAHAEKVGADAALIVVPYYNKPSQRGLIAHFTALAERSRLPIIIYNIPGRSVADMSTETMAELAQVADDHRREGCHRQSGAGFGAARGLRGGFHPAFGQ